MTNSLIGLEVVGDEMAPNILEGDIVYVNVAATPRANAKDAAVLKVRGNYHVCKFTRFGKQIMMIHDNGAIRVVKDYEVEIIGCVTKVVEYEENHSAGNTMAFA